MKTLPTILLAALVLALPAASASAAIQVTGFASSQWGASDVALSVASHVIEDFEDATLVPNLLIGWESPAGNTAPAATLSNTFDPANDTGGAFMSGVWDGTRGLINTRDNQAHGYSAIEHWGDVVLQFAVPARSVGFSVQQMNLEARLVINGTDLGGLAALSGLALNEERLGYVRIDTTGTDTISALILRNGRAGYNDGFMLDHLAYQPASSSNSFMVSGLTPAQWGASDAVLGFEGYVIEDFEDATLVPCLLIGWETPAGNTALAATLPNTFDPANDPGGAFMSGVWDGTRGLINTRDNQAHGYSAVEHWGDVVLQFAIPARSVGFSVQQMNLEARLVVNGTDLGGLAALSGLALNEGRLGYVRIDATGTNAISEFTLRNGRAGYNDGFMLDHLAYQLAQPSLRIRCSGQVVLVSWPVTFPDWVLEWTGTLQAGAVWTSIMPPATNATEFVHTELSPVANRFFRLRRDN